MAAHCFRGRFGRCGGFCGAHGSGLGNPRIHSKEQLDLIAWSIERFGFINPVLIDYDNMVVAGAGRTMAGQLLELPSVPALRLGLDERAKRAYGLFDNRLGELAGWDKVLLPLELQDLSDIVNLGQQPASYNTERRP